MLQPLSSSQWIYYGVNSASLQKRFFFVIADHFSVAVWFLPSSNPYLHIFSKDIKKIQGYACVYAISFNYNDFMPKAYLSSLLYFLFPLCFFAKQTSWHPGLSPGWKLFLGMANTTLQNPLLSLGHTYQRHQQCIKQKQWGISMSITVRDSYNIKLTDAEGGLTGAPGGRAADLIGWRADWPCSGAQGYIPTWGWWASVWGCACSHTDFSSRTEIRPRF